MKAPAVSDHTKCPFRVGDEVVFSPNEHAIGWSYPSFARIALSRGDTGVISRIEQGTNIYT